MLGLIPQGNSWTVFKGLPEGNNEQPEETAIREFEEESSLTFPYNNDNNNYNWDKKYEILYGVTSTKKLLQIYLIPAPLDIDISKFDISNVVKIDKGIIKNPFYGYCYLSSLRFKLHTQEKSSSSDKLKTDVPSGCDAPMV